MTRSNIICEYLDEVYPDHPLYPNDPFEKAKMKVSIDTIGAPERVICMPCD